MPTVATDLLSSKKFLFTLLVTIALLAASKLGAVTSEEAQSLLKYLWPAYLAAQGLADLGKGAATAKAAASAPASVTIVATEEKKANAAADTKD